MKKYVARFVSHGLFALSAAFVVVMKGIVGEVEAPAKLRK